MTSNHPLAYLVAASRLLPFFVNGDTARRRRRARAIRAYIGPNGGGKSLCSSFDLLPTLAGIRWDCSQPDHWHSEAGVTSGLRTVLSTKRYVAPDGSDHPLWTPLTSWKQMVTAEHCDIELDEVAGVASSRSTHALPPAVETKVQELRRADCSLSTTAPSWKRADTILREVSQLVTLCQGFAGETVRLGDSSREWRSARMFLWRSYDATVFDEWTLEKRKRLTPLSRQAFWRPGSPAESVYDTFAYVEKLGQVTEAGVCIDCGGTRRRESCSCGSPTVRRRRTLAAAADEAA